MDATAFGILLGLGACSLYSLIRIVRQKSFDIRDIGTTMLCFLAGFTLPAGATLISAGVRGTPSSLPSSWREYVAVAGVAAIGLAIQYLIEACRAVWPKPASDSIPAADSTQENGQARETPAVSNVDTVLPR